MRLFVALEIPSGVRDNLATLMGELRGTDGTSAKNKARWVRPENVHVTLKFIGQVDGDRLESMRAALTEARSDSPVDLRFHGLGFFPNEKRPRVFWAGIRASQNLISVAGAIDEHLGKLGIPRETRAFSPHLTLARFDPPGISEKLRTAAQENTDRDFGTLRTGEFHLIESKTHPGGAEYTRLASFQFAKAEA